MRVDEPRKHQATAQVDDVVVGMVRPDRVEDTPLDDHAVAHADPAVLLRSQGAAGERADRGVQERPAEERQRTIPDEEGRRWAAASPSKACRSDAATASAMVAGSLPCSSGRPMGVVIRLIADGVVSLVGELLAEPRPLGPRADQADRAEVLAAQRGVAQRGVLRVVVSHHQDVRPGRQLCQDQLGEHWDVVHVHPGLGVVERSQGLARELPGARVDQVQVHVVPGQDPRQLQPDVADPEDRDRGSHLQRLQQHRHLPAAALHAMGEPRLVGEVRHEHRGAGPRTIQQLAGPVHRGRLEVAAADRAPGAVPPDDHLRPGRTGRVPPHHGEGHQDPRLASGPQVLHRGQPLHREPPSPSGPGAARRPA